MSLELDLDSIRPMFPALHQQVYGRDLVYFDNAATTQKPQQVIDALDHYYSVQNSNIHRGVHYLSQQATVAFEESRKDICRFINAAHAHEIIFTRGTTEAINLVASSFGKKFLKKGDEVIITGMEHHSNIVPWQMSCEEHGA
ncbi:MAG: aminotransferase class V-fold PLP-dependent enzyme, partial [Bacteroidota bacterium]